MKKQPLLIILLMAGLLSVTSCKKDKDKEPTPTPMPTPTPTALTINSSYRATYSLDGTAVSNVYGDAGFNMSYGAGGGISSDGINPSTRYFDGSVTDANDKGITITKGTLSVASGGYPSDTAFRAFFPAGSYSYSPAGAVNPAGIVVGYYDGTTFWTTDKGTANQTGSAFSIVASQNVTGRSDYTMKVYATFNCKLYDGNGNVKTLTSGVFIGDFANL
jgi:hypothetical protein